jgi:hypothetical protein
LPFAAQLPSFAEKQYRIFWTRMPHTVINKSPAKRDDLINLVTAPVLSQVNLNGAEILKKIAELQASLDIIARQVSREIPSPESRTPDMNPIVRLDLPAFFDNFTLPGCEPKTVRFFWRYRVV